MNKFKQEKNPVCSVPLGRKKPLAGRAFICRFTVWYLEICKIRENKRAANGLNWLRGHFCHFSVHLRHFFNPLPASHNGHFFAQVLRRLNLKVEGQKILSFSDSLCLSLSLEKYLIKFKLKHYKTHGVGLKLSCRCY